MEVESSGNVVEKNSFKSNDDHGLVIQKGSGNRIIKNTAKNNDDDDMWTDVDGTDNTWEKNKFKTGNVPD